MEAKQTSVPDATSALLVKLNAFKPEHRRDAFIQLAATMGLPNPSANFNMHCHSFFSYNANGWSPSRIAYECRKQGLYAAALCDFDVLDGLAEFSEAGRLLGLRTATHLETRAYVRELNTMDISSPGEPGVSYIMGCGFITVPLPTTAQGFMLAQLRQGAQDRNLALISRVNAALPVIAINYTQDVLPLTPNGVATERHIIRAYCAKVQKVFADLDARAAFWAPLLKCAVSAFAPLEQQSAKMEDLVRNALAKRGGIGYIQPDDKTFPLAEAFIDWVHDCHAIPTIAWLDGTSNGEADCNQLLDLMISKGCAALNIIPDRNWNIKDPQEAIRKQSNLTSVINAARQRALPINIGTEMNKAGVPFVDDISGPVLSRYAETFIMGMQIMVGQTVLGTYAQAPYLGARAEAEFKDLNKRNNFYASIGALPPLTTARAIELTEAGPERAFTMLADALKKNA